MEILAINGDISSPSSDSSMEFSPEDVFFSPLSTPQVENIQGQM
jgi:hypothetical protein